MLSNEEIELFGAIELAYIEGFKASEATKSLDYEHDLPALFSLKQNGASLESLAQQIFHIELKRSGVHTSMQQCTQVAQAILLL